MKDKGLRTLSAGPNYEKTIKRPAARTKCGLVEPRVTHRGCRQCCPLNYMGLRSRRKWLAAIEKLGKNPQYLPVCTHHRLLGLFVPLLYDLPADAIAMLGRS